MTSSADIMIRNATVITVDAERRVIRDGAIVIEKDRIKDVGKSADMTKAYQAKRVIDGSGKLVMPGIVNLHFHAYHGVHRGVAPENLTGETWGRWVHTKVMQHVTPEAEVTAMQRFATVGVEPTGSTPEAFAGIIRSEVPKWDPLVKSARTE